MVCATEIQRRVNHTPKVALESSVAVRHNGERQAMQTVYLPKEKLVSNMDGVRCFLARYEVYHFRKPINHDENGIITPLSTWKAYHEIHAHRCPRMRRDGKGSVQSGVCRSAFRNLADKASFDKARRIPSDGGPEEAPLNEGNGAVAAHMASAMEVGNDQVPEARGWDAELNTPEQKPINQVVIRTQTLLNLSNDGRKERV